MSSTPTTELASFISADTFLHIPSSLSSAAGSSDGGGTTGSPVLFFFIPGNPGLVSYYHTFLSLLSDPGTSPSTSRCVVAGLSLGGFEVSAADGEDAAAPSSGGERRTTLLLGPGKNAPEEDEEGGPLYSLREQVDLTERRLGNLLGLLEEERRRRRRDSEAPGLLVSESGLEKLWKVILVGHSVGAYIALEVLQRHRARNSSPLVERVDGCDKCFDITAAILLTPTVVDIALSPSGKVLAPLLKYIPGFPLFVSLAAKFVTRLLPTRWLEKLIETVMGRHAPDAAVRSTVSFLRSRNGVRQSLEMAGDEMRDIGGDRWGEEVWGVGDAGKKDMEDEWTDGINSSKLVFYFATRDHWVADQTREQIISTRGGREGTGRPRMIVAEVDELVHGWCIRHNGLVAERVDGWVEELVERR